MKYTAKFGVCTIKIKANFASTEYGYIQVGKILSENIYQTSNFIEKPTLQQAENYLEKGDYFWNSGIYIFNIDFMLEQAKTWRKELLKEAWKSLSYSTKKNNNIKLATEPYRDIIPLSSDYAIIQNIKQMIMIKANFLWQDIGSWYTLWQVQNKDSFGNYCKGDIIKLNTNNSYIYSDNKLIIIIGVDNIVVVDTKEALLVAKNQRPEK